MIPSVAKDPSQPAHEQWKPVWIGMAIPDMAWVNNSGLVSTPDQFNLKFHYQLLIGNTHALYILQNTISAIPNRLA